MSFQQSVDKLTQVFRSLQGAWRGPARSNWAFSQLGGTEAGAALRGRISQNFAFGQGFQNRIIADAIKHSVATGTDPMSSLGRSTDTAAKRIAVMAAGTSSDYFGGIDPKTSKLLRLGTQTPGERRAYLAATNKSRMMEAIEAGKIGADVASPFARLAYHAPGTKLDKNGNPTLPVQLTQGAVDTLKSQHGYLTNLFSGLSGKGMEKAQETLRDMGEQIERIDRTGGKAWGDRIANIETNFKKISEFAETSFKRFSDEEHARFQSPTGTHWMATAMSGQEGTPSKWFRARGLAGIYSRQAIAGVGKYFRGAGADFRSGAIDWRGLHAITGAAMGSLAAAGGPAFATLSGSAGLAIGAIGQGMIPATVFASQHLQGFAQWMQNHPTLAKALGWGTGISLTAMGAGAAISRIGSGARLVAGVAQTATATGVEGAALASKIPGLGPVGVGIALGAAKPEGSRVPVHAPMVNPFMPPSMIKSILNAGQQAGDAIPQNGPAAGGQSPESATRKLAIAWGNMAVQPSWHSLEESYFAIQQRALVDPLTMEQQKQSLQSLEKVLEEIATNTGQTKEALDKLNVGNR